LTNKPQKLSQEGVVNAIRQGILATDLVPGQRLVEAELCEQLGATRRDVGSALILLDRDGLVERIQNRGFRVRVVGLEEALQIVELRMVVESHCVGRAAERITDAEIVELRELAKQLEARTEQGDIVGFAECTNKLFQTYVRIADLPVAEKVLAQLRAQNSHHRFKLTYLAGRAKIATPYWLERIDAICCRDPERARETVRRHSENVREAMKALDREHSPFAVAQAPARPFRRKAMGR